MPIPLADQRAALHAHLTRALGQAQGAPVPVDPVLAVEPTTAWRSTARLHWRDGLLGYHRAESHDLLDIDRCPVLRPPLPALLAAVRARLAPHLRGEGTLRLTAAPDAPSGTVELRPESAPSPALRRALEALVADEPTCHGAVIRRGADVVARHGDPVDRLGPAAVAHPTGSFVQAHQDGNAALVAAVLDALRGAERVLELHAGSGNFTLALAAAGHHVTAIEHDPHAARALADEAARRGLADRVDPRCGDAERPPRGRHDAALLDPPRAGARGAVDALAERDLDRIVYVSCNPATLARDIARLAARGWRIERARPFDLFPHTGHVEALTVLVPDPQRDRGGKARAR
ncbi:MAG: class I SAM-dependent RNA methyltransferase [Myxococcales bacterium]|nr:class I SAM-dependent RNA methyltransferase [Myxococcales bacterium]